MDYFWILIMFTLLLPIISDIEKKLQTEIHYFLSVNNLVEITSNESNGLAQSKLM